MQSRKHLKAGRWGLLISLLLGLLPVAGTAAGTWQECLSTMPLDSTTPVLSRTNCVGTMLRAFRSNDVVKALIFLPGATDEFYMFRRASAHVTNASPSLLDAVVALTNQTLIKATFRAPFLLLHTDEDPLEPQIISEHRGTEARIRSARFVAHAQYDDRDWNFIQPILKKSLRLDVRPWAHSYDSWHFYRHSFAAWNLTGWEALQAIALAGKTKATVQRRMNLFIPQSRIVFESDTRIRARPKF